MCLHFGVQIAFEADSQSAIDNNYPGVKFIGIEIDVGGDN